MSSPEQPKNESEVKLEKIDKEIETLKTEVEELHAKGDTATAAKKAEELEAKQTLKKEIEALYAKREHKEAPSEEKKAGFFTNAAKGGGIAAGVFAGGIFAGIWGLFKLYGGALFGDIIPKGGGGGKKSGGGGGHGGGHGGGGHH